MEYIYIRTNELCDFYDVYKLGQTTNIPERNDAYITYEIKKGYFINVYQILNYTSRDVEIQLKIYLNSLNFHIISDAGTEYYKKEFLNFVEPFFFDNNIIYKKLTFEEITNLTRKKRMNINKLNFNNLNIQLNVWQKEAFECYLNFMESENKTGIIIAPTGCGKSFLISLLSIFYILCTKCDVLILTKRKEIFDTKFITDLQNLILKTGEKINVCNLINNICENTIFNGNNINNTIFIANSDKFITSKNFKNYQSIDFGKIKKVIFDESHWVGSDLLGNFLLYLKNNVCDKIIGFSATPVRTNFENKIKTLEIFKQYKSNEFNIIYSLGYIKSIDEKYRLPVKWLLIPIKDENVLYPVKNVFGLYL